MYNKRNKNLFKLNNWKRWLILFFTLGFAGLFIGLSFSLKSSNIKVSNDYANNVSLVIKPTENGNEIDNQTYSKQLLFNLKTRLEYDYPSSIVTSEYENDNVWKINITNINNDINKNLLLENVLNKNPLTLTAINATLNNPLYQSTINNNSLFNEAQYSNGNSYTLKMNESDARQFVNWINNTIPNNGEKIIIWKNFDILQEIVNNAINNEGYVGSMYEFLFVDGWTPEEYESKGENDSTRPPIFKDSFIWKGKTYKATDFIVSKNDLSEFNGSSSLTISKNFGVSNSHITTNDVKNEYYDVSYWISSYNLDNCVVSFNTPNNGNDSYILLVIALVTFFALLSIFVVINYGYLGIFAIVIMSIVIFLSLLMVCVFFGDYDSITIVSILMSTIVCFDFVVSFFERIKKQFLKGNSISKAIRNTIKNSKISIILKSLFLLLFIGAVYGVVSFISGQFSLIVLISALAIPIILIPLLFMVSKILVGIDKFENDPKIIGIWSKKYKNFIQNNKKETISESLGIDETLEISKHKLSVSKNDVNSLDYKAKQWFRYGAFRRISNSKSKAIVLSTISYILVFGIVIFLVSFFINGKTLTSGFNVSQNDKNQTVLTIGKSNKEIFSKEEVNNIENILGKNGIDSSDINLISNTMIKVVIDKDFSNEKINAITTEITSLYNVIVIPSNLVSSNTFNVMKYTLYGILIAIIAICLFVLFWMGWSKALTLLISALISLISLVCMVGFGLIQINSLLPIALMTCFIIFVLTNINLLMSIHAKLKTQRIEELTSNDIKEIINKQVFKMLRPLLITNVFTILMFYLFLILWGALPFTFVLFVIGFVIVNLIYTLFLSPKILVWLEIKRARRKRKVILENYWDTEKVKEQTFNGINNIK